MVSSPGYGKRTLYGPEGAIRLNDKDTVIAGTNLFEGNDVVSSPNESVKTFSENTIKAPVAQATDMSRVEALLRELVTVSKNPTPAPSPIVKLDNKVLTDGVTERQRVEASGIQ